jgi:hypothetical protein
MTGEMGIGKDLLAELDALTDVYVCYTRTAEGVPALICGGDSKECHRAYDAATEPQGGFVFVATRIALKDYAARLAKGAGCSDRRETSMSVREIPVTGDAPPPTILRNRPTRDECIASWHQKGADIRENWMVRAELIDIMLEDGHEKNQTGVARALGTTQGTVSKLRKWRDSGYAGDGPFGLRTAAERAAAKAQRDEMRRAAAEAQARADAEANALAKANAEAMAAKSEQEAAEAAEAALEPTPVEQTVESLQGDQAENYSHGHNSEHLNPETVGDLPATEPDDTEQVSPGEQVTRTPQAAAEDAPETSDADITPADADAYYDNFLAYKDSIAERCDEMDPTEIEKEHEDVMRKRFDLDTLALTYEAKSTKPLTSKWEGSNFAKDLAREVLRRLERLRRRRPVLPAQNAVDSE